MRIILSRVSYVGKRCHPITVGKIYNLDKFKCRLFDETDIRLVNFSIVAQDEEPMYCCLNCL